MLRIALVLAVVVWIGTFTYWLVDRRRRAKQPQNFDQLQARIDQLEERLRQAQTSPSGPPPAAAPALDELRRRAERVERRTVRGSELPDAVRRQLDSVEQIFETFDRDVERMFNGPTSAFGRLTRDLHRSLRDPHTTWTVTTTTTREAPTRPNGQAVPPTPPTPPAPPARPRPPTRTREQSEPTVPARPVRGRSVYERLRDKWPTTTTSETPEEPESSRPEEPRKTS